MFEHADKLKWEDCLQNPLIRPIFPTPIVADPTFLPPDKTHDGKWHLFAHSLMGIHHYVSGEGVKWKRRHELVVPRSMRPFLYTEDATFYLFYEKFLSYFPQRSRIEVRHSEDLVKWSAPVIVLRPSFPWHRRTCGNPCVIKNGGGYRLYYSAALVFLKDCKFSEPEFIGMASAKSILGPYNSRPDPVLSPDKSDVFCNHGAGSIKVIKTQKQYVGFHNGIYIDGEGKSRSAIRLIHSKDGITWNGFERGPFLKPEGSGWKHAFVYACDTRLFEGKLYLYYNARNGWLWGKECIGLCTGSLSD